MIEAKILQILLPQHFWHFMSVVWTTASHNVFELIYLNLVSLENNILIQSTLKYWHFFNTAFWSLS